MLGWAADVLGDYRTWVLLGLATLVALVACRPLARRVGWPTWPTLGMLLGAALIAALTLGPAPGHPIGGPEAGAVGHCLRTLADPAGWWHALGSLDSRGERAGNVAMFVPATFFAVLATRRPVVVAAIGAAAPVLVELSQAVLAAGRDCAADDWVNNATGALLGAAAGAVVLVVARSVRAGAPQHRVQRPQQDDHVERE